MYCCCLCCIHVLAYLLTYCGCRCCVRRSYLRQTVNETLRWAVISPLAGRVQDVDTVIGGHVIPASVSSFLSHLIILIIITVV